MNNEQLLRPKLENIISGHNINNDDADWLRAALAQHADCAQAVAHIENGALVYCTLPVGFTGSLYTRPQADQEQVQQPTTRDDNLSTLMGVDVTREQWERFKQWDAQQPQVQATVSTEQCGGPLCGSPEFGANHHPLCKHATQAQAQELPDSFASWVRSNLPADTVIGDPDWWAPRIWRAALAAKQERKPMTEPVAMQEVADVGLTPVVIKPFTPAQRRRLWENSKEHHKDAASFTGFERIVTLTERAHGIVEKGVEG